MFCFVCGIIGHTDQHCKKLLEMGEDDGVRGWGPELRVENRRQGGGGSNRWLRNGGNVQGETHVANLTIMPVIS